jgi:SAM-dependent methyltransferase
MDKQKIRQIVRDGYGKIVQNQQGCGCGCSSCGPDSKEFAKSIGYSEDELNSIPEESNLALSCGNPTAIANLKEGETVLDLGSGAGFDCFIAANKVGPSGKVIGVDMTPEMVAKARDNAQKNNITNIEFRLGEIENLPVEDNSIDVVISNCVINLSTDKQRVFQEIYRVLKSGGRVAISDMVILKELPVEIQENIEAYVGCIAGAISVDEYKNIVESSGLRESVFTVKGTSVCIDPDTNDPFSKAAINALGEEKLEDYIASAYIEAYK